MTHGDKLRSALELEIGDRALANLLERYCPKNKKINCEGCCLTCLACWEEWLGSEVSD